MILYCCCLDVDGDTDSHPSCSRSCFGSFFPAMKLSARDRRINGIIADLRGASFNCSHLEFDCTARSIIKFANVAMTLIYMGCSEIVIRNDGVYYVDELPFGIETGVIDAPFPEPAPTPISFADDELPF